MPPTGDWECTELVDVCSIDMHLRTYLPKHPLQLLNQRSGDAADVRTLSRPTLRSLPEHSHRTLLMEQKRF